MGVADRQVHGVCATTGALTGACNLLRHLLTQSGMLQYKFDVIMKTTILCPISNLLIGRSLFSLKHVRRKVTSSLKKTYCG